MEPTMWSLRETFVAGVLTGRAIEIRDGRKARPMSIEDFRARYAGDTAAMARLDGLLRGRGL